MLKIPRHIRVFNPELLFVLYYWGFIFLRPLLQAHENISTLILFVYVLLLLGYFIVGMILNKDSRIGKAVLLVLIFFVCFLLDSIIRRNSVSFKYVYVYIYSGIIPVLFLSKIRDANATLKYFAWFSLIALLLFGASPLINNMIFSNYMDYGFKLVMPAFFGLFLGYHYFKIRWMLIFEILCFIGVLVFANRGALLSTVCFVSLYFLLMHPNRKKIIIRWFIPACILLLIALLNLEFLAKYIYRVVTDLGYDSYSLIMILEYFETNSFEDLFSGRLELWSNASSMIMERPILGHGIGNFEARYGLYPHNIYHDIMTSYGIVGLMVIGFFVLLSFVNIWKSNTSIRILWFVFFLLWFPKLFLSSFFLGDIGFWCFISFPFLQKVLNQKGPSLMTDENIQGN
jgi:O-antigen ligase